MITTHLLVPLLKSVSYTAFNVFFYLCWKTNFDSKCSGSFWHLGKHGNNKVIELVETTPKYVKKVLLGNVSVKPWTSILSWKNISETQKHTLWSVLIKLKKLRLFQPCAQPLPSCTTCAHRKKNRFSKIKFQNTSNRFLFSEKNVLQNSLWPSHKAVKTFFIMKSPAIC